MGKKLILYVIVALFVIFFLIIGLEIFSALMNAFLGI